MCFNPRMPTNEWLDDPEIQAQLRARSVRNGILRSAILWTPPFLGCLGLLLFFVYDQVTDGGRGTIFLLVILAIGTLLFGSQSIQALRDVTGTTRSTTGVVTRRWSKMDSLVMKTHYVRIGTTILRGDQDLLGDVLAGDTIEVRYYPHSAVAFAVTVIDKAPRVEPKTRTGLSFRGRK